MSKLIINKHYRNASAITENVFYNKKDYNEENPELLREGEIVISNEEANPGIYIFTAGEGDSAMTGQGGRVIDVTSPEHSHLSSGYTKSQEETPIISSGDSVEAVVGKIDRKFDKQTEHIAGITGQLQTLSSAITTVDADLQQSKESLQSQITAETSARQSKDEELSSLVSANTESIAELSGATSKESMDTFVTENFEGGYDPSTREIKLQYKLGDGTTKEDLMVVDVTEFTTQIDFLLTAYTYTVENQEGETHNGEFFAYKQKVLVLVFRVTDSGVQHDETVYFNVSEMIGEHVVLTDEQYEALTEEDKNNGFFYYTYEEE